MTIRPLYNKVVLRKAEKEVTTKSGLILSAAAAEATDSYEVLAVGPGLMMDGVLVPCSAQVGDKVLIDKYAGNAVKVGGEEFLIVHDNDILGVIE